MIAKSTLRKAAILIAAIDTGTADALLDSMGELQATIVREAVMELDDVSDLERESVLEEFLASRSPVARLSDTGIEIDDSLARQFSKRPVPIHEPIHEPVNAEVAPPFRFLHEAETAGLAQYLEREHPQTIAVVLSHLPPERAATLLTNWSPSLQLEIVRRIAVLDQTSPEVIRDIEHELESLLITHVHTLPKRAEGTEAVRAILQAMDSLDRRQLVSGLSHTDARLASELSLGSASTNPQPQPIVPTALIGKASSGTLKRRASSVGTRPLRATLKSRSESTAASGVRYTFDDVVRLDAKSVALLLGHADSQVVLLSMAGAERSLLDRMAVGMPAAEVRAFQYRLNHLGPTRLRDVDAAQATLAALAGQLAERGLIPLPKNLELTADS